MKRLFNFMAMLGLMVGLLAATDARSDGPFVTLEGGASFAGDTGLESVGPWDRDTGMGTGYVFGGLVGYEWADIGGGRLRAGIGGNYRGGFDGDNSFSADLGHGLTGTVGQKGDISSASGVLAAEYDVMQLAYKSDGFTLYPTVGAGVGFANNSVDNQRLFAQITDGVDTIGIECDGGDSSNTDLSWHVQGGVGADIGPNVSVRALYRYVDLGAAETTDGLDCWGQINGNKVTNTVALGMESEDINLRNHEIVGQLSYRF